MLSTETYTKSYEIHDVSLVQQYNGLFHEEFIYSLPASFLPNTSHFFLLWWLFDVLEVTVIMKNVLGRRKENSSTVSPGFDDLICYTGTQSHKTQ